MKQEKIMKRVNEHYLEVQSLGYEVLGTFLVGSQNYELDYEFSDIDTKSIIVPTFDDFLKNRSPISTTHIFSNNEHSDLKDIRKMFECFKKQNINFVEVLFTKYFVINPKYADLFQSLIDNRELVAHYNNYAAVNCMVGAAMEKYKALEHPYPTIVDKIEKYGWDGKQLHHLVRYRNFLVDYILGKSYEQCLVSGEKDFLLYLKRNEGTLEEARELARKTLDDIKKIKEYYMENNLVIINKEVEVILETVLSQILRKRFREELIL